MGLKLGIPDGVDVYPQLSEIRDGDGVVESEEVGEAPVEKVVETIGDVAFVAVDVKRTICPHPWDCCLKERACAMSTNMSL